MKVSAKKFLAIAALGALIIPSLALASVIRSDSNILQTENIAENVYLAGANPLIAGTVQGDLMAIGGHIYVSGQVVQDATLAGETVNVSGHVGGDLRAVGKTVTIDGPVDGELFVYGEDVVIGPHAIIQGDVNVTGARVKTDSAAQMMSSKINITSGDTDKNNAPRPFVMDTNKFLGAAFWITAGMFIAGVLIVVLILHALMPSFTKKLVEGSSTGVQIWKNFLTGFVLMFAMPFAAIVCYMTIIGGFLGTLILLAYFGFILMSMLLEGVVFGGLLYMLLKKPKKYAMPWWWILVGVAGLCLVSWVPYVGWIFSLVFFFVAWGAIARIKWAALRGKKANGAA